MIFHTGYTIIPESVCFIFMLSVYFCLVQGNRSDKHAKCEWIIISLLCFIESVRKSAWGLYLVTLSTCVYANHDYTQLINIHNFTFLTTAFHIYFEIMYFLCGFNCRKKDWLEMSRMVAYVPFTQGTGEQWHKIGLKEQHKRSQASDLHGTHMEMQDWLVLFEAIVSFWRN